MVSLDLYSPYFPSDYFLPLLILISLIAIIYGGLTTWRQSDMKRLIAYPSVAHMGLVTLAIFTHSVEGVFACLIMVLAHGLISSGLFISSSFIYIRHHSRIIKYFRGLTLTMPLLSSLTLSLVLSNIAFPLTFNFIGEFFSILVAFNYSSVVVLVCCGGALISTIYALYFYNRIYFGSLTTHVLKSRYLSYIELSSLVPLLIPTLFFGVHPDYLFKSVLVSSYLNISL